MKFHFVERRMAVSEALKEYAQKKISKLDKYFKKEAEAQITFATEGNRHILEVTVNNDGMYYRARIEGDDVYASADSALAAIERQIHKNKTRLEKRLRQGAFEREIPSAMAEPIVDEEQDFDIIRTKQFTLKPMTPEEAILQMNLLSHEFFVFRNFTSGGRFAVVYKRKGGGYGMIEEG